MPEPPADLRDLLALSLVPGLGPRLTAALLRHFGSAAAARTATATQLQAVPLIGAKLAAQFAESLRAADIDREWDAVVRHGVTVIPLTAPEYPAPLREIPDPPPLLYLRGAFAAADANAVAVVGSRRCTGYGRRMAEAIAGGLARAGWTVVSGLALGIDGAAHAAALKVGGRTLAVLAGGLSRIYPPQHADLAEEVAKAGALVTEATMLLDPQAGMFPARNRIISGLSRGVVVVEAPDRSGALITAEHALEQGREVFAVPGPADSARSAGCLALIRNGARLVRGADDILEDLAGIAPLVPPPPQEPPKPTEPPALDEVQRKVWDALADGPKPIDAIVRTVGLPVTRVSGVLMALEMKRVVRRLPGNVYERAT